MSALVNSMAKQVVSLEITRADLAKQVVSLEKEQERLRGLLREWCPLLGEDTTEVESMIEGEVESKTVTS